MVSLEAEKITAIQAITGSQNLRKKRIRGTEQGNRFGRSSNRIADCVGAKTVRKPRGERMRVATACFSRARKLHRRARRQDAALQGKRDAAATRPPALGRSIQLRPGAVGSELPR